MSNLCISADDLPVGVYFQLEDYGWDEVEGLPGADKECLAEWEGLACEIVAKHFRQACRNIWPLLIDLNFKSISIGIDLFSTAQGEAGYYHLDSDMNTGYHGFYITHEILREYLASHLNEENMLDPELSFREVSPYCKYIWEHELIHLCDWRTITEFKFDYRSTDVREFFIHFLLTYRNEGIADLWYAMKGHSRCKSMNEAKNRFHEDLRRFGTAEWNDACRRQDLKEEVHKASGFYSAGPWMILHILGCSDYPHRTPLTHMACDLISNVEIMDDASISEIVNYALKISNDDFVRYITKDGADGKPFIDIKELHEITERICSVNHSVTPIDTNENCDDHQDENKALVDFFEKHC